MAVDYFIVINMQIVRCMLRYGFSLLHNMISCQWSFCKVHVAVCYVFMVTCQNVL